MKKRTLNLKLIIFAVFTLIGITGCSDDKAAAKQQTEAVVEKAVEATKEVVDTAKNTVKKKCGEGKCADSAKKDGESTEMKCGEGKCGDSMKDKAVDAAKGAAKDAMAGKCGADKLKGDAKDLIMDSTDKKCGDKTDADMKCGEGKCGDKTDADKKCGEGKCGDSMKDKAMDAAKGAVQDAVDDGVDAVKEKAVDTAKDAVKKCGG